jgi:hypothetical protein
MDNNGEPLVTSPLPSKKRKRVSTPYPISHLSPLCERIFNADYSDNEKTPVHQYSRCSLLPSPSSFSLDGSPFDANRLHNGSFFSPSIGQQN